MGLVYDRTLLESLRLMRIQYRLNENLDQSVSEEMTKEDFDDMLDTMYEPYIIHGEEFKPSDILWALDPDTYKTLKKNFFNDNSEFVEKCEDKEEKIDEEKEYSLRDGTGPHGKRNRKETEDCPYEDNIEKNEMIDNENEYYSIEEMTFRPSEILFKLNKELYNKLSN